MGAKKKKVKRLICIVLLIFSFIIGFLPNPTLIANANEINLDKTISDPLEVGTKTDTSIDTNGVEKLKSDV